MPGEQQPSARSGDEDIDTEAGYDVILDDMSAVSDDLTDQARSLAAEAD